jgi:hypothetical protein
MARAWENACPEWKYIVGAAIVAVARRKRYLTVDDVLDELGQIHHCPMNHSMDALGPAMVRASKMSVLVNTGQRIRSKIAHKNGNLRTVWESKVIASLEAE